MSHAIELEKVTKRFGNCLAVDSLDLIVPEGTIYGFIGPNGSGKTTTLRMILRILYPDSGQVTVLGCSRGAAANDHVGYLPEERGLYRKMRVRELLRFFAQLKGMRRCGGEIDDWLERFDLARWANEKVETLSKGMAQKVQFIGAIVAKPRLLVLDEPFTGLDPVNMDVLRDAVRSAHQDGTTVIFSTHDMDMAERLCDTIFMIYRGKKVLDGTLADDPGPIRRGHDPAANDGRRGLAGRSAGRDARERSTSLQGVADRPGRRSPSDPPGTAEAHDGRTFRVGAAFVARRLRADRGARVSGRGGGATCVRS